MVIKLICLSDDEFNELSANVHDCIKEAEKLDDYYLKTQILNKLSNIKEILEKERRRV